METSIKITELENLRIQKLFAELHRMDVLKLYYETVKLMAEAEIRCENINKRICAECTANQIQEFLNER